MRFALGLIVTAIASFGTSQMDPTSELIFTNAKAIALLPPQIVSTGMTSSAYWSPNGKFLLVNSVETKTMGEMLLRSFENPAAPPKNLPDQVLALHDVERQTTRIVWRGRVGAVTIDDASWLPGSASALIVVRHEVKDDEGNVTGEGRQVVWSLSATSGQMTTAFQPDENELVSIETDTRAKGAVLAIRRLRSQANQEPSARYIWVRPNGSISGAIPAKGNFAYGQIEFFEKGNRPMLIARENAGEKGLRAVWLDMDFASGHLKEVPPLNVRAETEPEPEFRLISGATMTASDARAGATPRTINLNSAWLIAKEKSSNQSSLVAAEVEKMQLSPAMNAVFYTTKGVAIVRPLISVPKEWALSALAHAERARLISDAKQVATALHIYAADYDDVLPSNNSDWMEALYPYTKNRQLLDGFVYTFGGGSLSDIKNPANTEIGYKEGPGGRAVAYADGHVKWVPNP